MAFRLRPASALLLGAALVAAPALRAEYPDKPFRFVIEFPPGGAPEIGRAHV